MRARGAITDAIKADIAAHLGDCALNVNQRRWHVMA